MVAGGAITRSTPSIEPPPEARRAKQASGSPRAPQQSPRGAPPRAAPGSGPHELGGASASAVRELPPDAALSSPSCRAAAEVGDALAGGGSLVPATPSPSRPPSQLCAGLQWEAPTREAASQPTASQPTASQPTAVLGRGAGGAPPARQGSGTPSTGSATPAHLLRDEWLARGAHARPPVAPHSSAPEHRSGQRGGEAARQLPGGWLGPPLSREAAGSAASEAHIVHAARAAAAQHASAAIAEARAIELRAALDAIEAALVSAHGAAGAGATLGSSPPAAAAGGAGGAGGGAVDGEAVAHQLARLRRRAALCSELAMRQRLLAHALHTDGGAGSGGDGGGQARAATAEERAAAVVQIEAELAAWERLALPLPPPRWAEPTATGRPPLAQEPTAAAAPLASASAVSASATAAAATDAAMASSPARAAPVTTAAASSAGTAAAAAGVISQMRVEQQGQQRRLGGATACFAAAWDARLWALAAPRIQEARLRRSDASGELTGWL